MQEYSAVMGDGLSAWLLAGFVKICDLFVMLDMREAEGRREEGSIFFMSSRHVSQTLRGNQISCQVNETPPINSI